jgi:hypothetical protein
MGAKGSNKTTTTSNTTADQAQQQSQTYTPNQNIQDASIQALSGAQSAANAPFSMPVAPVAGFSPFQQQAFNQIQGMQGMAQPYFNQAQGYMQGSAAPITGQDVSQYYNPMAQNVTNQMQNIFGQQNRMATSNAVRAAGGVGADRIGVAQGNLANQQGLAAGQTYAGLYQQALQAAQQQKQMMAGAGFGIGQLGPAAQSAYLQGTGALQQAGAQQQALDQAQQNAIYQNRLAQIAYPFQTNQYLAGIAGGLAPAMGGTTESQSTSHGTTSGQSVTEKPSPSPLNQILGIGGTILGGVMGGPAGAKIGSSIGSGIGGAFGGNSAAGYGGAGAGGDQGGYMSGNQLMPGPGYYSPFSSYPSYSNSNYASGGAAYGKLAEQHFANSPAGNPYADMSSDDSDSDSKDNKYAAGGAAEDEEQLPMPGTRAPAADAASIVPNIRLKVGAGHAGLIGQQDAPLPRVTLPQPDLRPPPEEKQSDSGLGQIASVVGKVLPKMMSMGAARGGAVNPFDHYQGFQEGGDIGESWDPPPEIPFEGPTREPHLSLGDVASRAGDYYGNKAQSVGQAMAGPEPDPQSPWNVQKHVRSTADALGVGPPRAEAARPPPESPFSEPQAGPPVRQAREGDEAFSPGAVPMPLGNPKTKGGAKYAMVGELEKGEATPNTIAGISMNVKDESKFDPFDRHWDQHDPRFRGTEAENAHGLFQEGGDEWNKYSAWLKKNYPDAPWQDPRLQTRFLVENLKANYPETWAKMQNARTPGEAAAIFTSEYLKPAKQHEVRRVNKYLSGRGDEEAGGETNASARERNPYIVGNRDMTLANIRMPESERPYPGARERNWGTDLARSPWSALMVGGARMAQTVGPVGSALGAGIEAGMGHLEGQRKSLQTEEGINQRAEALYDTAKSHLDKYQRMTPYEKATSEWRETKLTTPTGAAGWKYKAWLAAHPGDEAGALEFAGGRRQVPEPQLRRWAADQALREKREDPGIDVDKRTEELFRHYKESSPSGAAKATPTAADLDYVKAHPETAPKFRERFGIDPPTG